MDYRIQIPGTYMQVRFNSDQLIKLCKRFKILVGFMYSPVSIYVSHVSNV